jgi:hypothetical protein
LGRYSLPAGAASAGTASASQIVPASRSPFTVVWLVKLPMVGRRYWRPQGIFRTP